MKIATYYSHLNGLEFLLVHKPSLWQEIQDVISGADAATCQTKVSKEARTQGRLFYSPRAMNKAIRTGFLAQNRDSVLKVRLCDIGNHPPLETADESRLKPGNFGRWPVAREHNLAAGAVGNQIFVLDLQNSLMGCLNEGLLRHLRRAADKIGRAHV